MYRFQRTARARGGKAMEAVQFAKEVAGYINTKYAPVSLQVYTELFGDVNTIYWYAEYKDLASLETIIGQLNADQEYWAILGKAADLFVEGSLHDTLMMSI
ncbi:MAG TPA: DUF6039 family protein [Anaerolineales bacterium]|nr:DUF6039 family protein [Anaerolineales bacterium]